MKNSKRFLGAFLSLVCVLTLAFAVPVSVEANYTYTVNLVIGDVDNATFDASAISITDKAGNTKSDYSIDSVKRTSGTGESVDFKLAISNLSYKDKISFDAARLVNLGQNSKYYVKGMRLSGSDAMVNPVGNTNVTIVVDSDDTYVTAYGVGKVIPYKVQYLGEKDEALYEEETLYGAEGENIIVPARHIPDYTPDVIEKKIALAKDTVVVFKYSKLEPTVITETVTKAETVYVNGGTNYTYEYEYIDGEPQVTTTTTPGQTTVNNRQENGAVRVNRNLGTDTTVANGNNAGGNENGNESENGAAGTEATNTSGEEAITIDEGDVPLAGGNTNTIPDPDVPKGGEDVNYNMARNIFITLVILIIIILITYTVVQHKRKATITNSSENKKNK